MFSLHSTPYASMIWIRFVGSPRSLQAQQYLSPLIEAHRLQKTCNTTITTKSTCLVSQSALGRATAIQPANFGHHRLAARLIGTPDNCMYFSIIDRIPEDIYEN